MKILLHTDLSLAFIFLLFSLSAPNVSAEETPLQRKTTFSWLTKAVQVPRLQYCTF